MLAIKHSSVLVGLVPGKYASKHAPTAARPASSQQKRARSPYAQHSLPPVSIVPRGRTDVQNCLTGERTTPDDESSIHASPHPLIMIRCQCGYGRNPQSNVVTKKCPILSPRVPASPRVCTPAPNEQRPGSMGQGAVGTAWRSAHTSSHSLRRERCFP